MPEESTTPDLVELVRRALDAINRGDKAFWLAVCDPEIENVPPRDWPESEPTRGPEAIWDFYVQGSDPWEGGATYEYGELLEVGIDTIVGEVRGEVRGQASGASVTWSFWQVVKSRDGRALRIEWFADRAEALEAAERLAESRE
jgi:ketosteroid isomerase-like protein